MSRPNPDAGQRLRSRARLLEFLKFRVLASQDAFFDAWRLATIPAAQVGPAESVQELQSLDLACFRLWLQPLWPEAAGLSDEDLHHCLEQAHRLYVDPPLRRNKA